MKKNNQNIKNPRNLFRLKIEKKSLKQRKNILKYFSLYNPKKNLKMMKISPSYQFTALKKTIKTSKKIYTDEKFVKNTISQLKNLKKFKKKT